MKRTCHEHVHTQYARHAHAMHMLAQHMLCTSYAARRGGRAQPARRYGTHRGGARGQGGAAPHCRTSLAAPHSCDCTEPQHQTQTQA